MGFSRQEYCSGVKNWLTGRDSDAGKDWGQEETGMTAVEMVGWHHWLNGHEFEETPGVGDGQGGLVGCSQWQSYMTEGLNWTEPKLHEILLHERTGGILTLVFATNYTSQLSKSWYVFGEGHIIFALFSYLIKCSLKNRAFNFWFWIWYNNIYTIIKIKIVEPRSTDIY